MTSQASGADLSHATADGPGVRVTDGLGLHVDTLFITARFNAFQAHAQGKTLVTFTAADESGVTIATLTFARSGDTWSNPITGAFGGIAAIGPPPPDTVSTLVRKSTDWLRTEGGQGRALIRLPPDCFPDPTTPILENALFLNDWLLDQVDIDQYLPVTPMGSFVAQLGETKQKELRRLRRSGAFFRTVPADEAQTVYELIARNRAARGYPMTMAWPQVEALSTAFPDRVSFHAIEREGSIIAGAIVLGITQAYPYVFYWGEDPAARRDAPVVMLAEGLIAIAHQRGAKLLDIGVSTEASHPNAGLLAFKRSIGCRPAAKRTYRLGL